MSRLSPDFWARPFAHRGLHDAGAGRPENSLTAFDAAITHGYAIELDVQLSSDGEAMVFHDYTLERLTAEAGRVDARDAAALSRIALFGADDQRIPTLAETLAMIAGRVPVLVEIKDQSGGFDDAGGAALEARVCEVLFASPYAEQYAVMSFNPVSVARCAALAPDIMRGIVSYDFEHPHDAHVNAAHRKALADLSDFEKSRSDFVSYGADSLPRAEVQALREAGVPVFCWTIRSPKEAERALAHSDQITFEGYLPDDSDTA